MRTWIVIAAVLVAGLVVWARNGAGAPRNRTVRNATPKDKVRKRFFIG